MNKPRGYAARIEQGLCGACGGPRDRPDRTACAECREKRKACSKNRRDTLISQGNCPECGKPSTPNRRTRRCVSCAEKHSKRSLAATMNGNCYTCKKPRERKDRNFCNACLSYAAKARKAIRDDNIACGFCITCGKNPMTAGHQCLRCFFGHAANRAGIGFGNGPMLEEIWNKQEGRCALTGLPMIPGNGASVDHIVPRCRGGGNERENLRWVLNIANRAKSSMTDEEFVSMCKAVAEHSLRKEAPW